MPEPVAWWLILEVMGLIAFPIAFVLFSSLPDRGYAFAKVFGLLFVGYGLWMGGAAVSLPNSRESIFGLMALVLAASLALAILRRREMVRWLADNWRYLLAAEAVFVAGFAFFCLLRSHMHDINYGEKPQNLAFLNAVLRDDTLPAYDPWYSGHDLSYYYLGHLTVAILARLAHTPASVAFNLGSATIGALAAMAVFGIGYNLVAAGGRVWRGVAVGVVAVVLLLIVSNLEGLFELLAAHGVGNQAFYHWWDIHDLDGPRSTDKWYPTEFWWWGRAAFVSDTYGGKEFPFTSFLFGDIHAHTAALPFALLSVGLALNVARSPKALDWRFWRRRPGILVLAALALGSLAFVNAVDLPTYATLVALAAFVANYAGRGRPAISAAARALTYLAPLAIVAVLLYLPFYLDFHPVGDGIQPLEAATRPSWIPLKAVVLRPTHFLILWGPPVWLACTLAGVALATLGRRAMSRAAVGWACLAWAVPVGLWALMLAIHRAPWGLAEEISHPRLRLDHRRLPGSARRCAVLGAGPPPACRSRRRNSRLGPPLRLSSDGSGRAPPPGNGVLLDSGPPVGTPEHHPASGLSGLAAPQRWRRLRSVLRRGALAAGEPGVGAGGRRLDCREHRRAGGGPHLPRGRNVLHQRLLPETGRIRWPGLRAPPEPR